MFSWGEAGVVRFVRVSYGKVWQASLGSLGWVLVRYGLVRQVRLGEFRWVAFWLGRCGFVWHLRIGTFSLGKLR